MITRLVKFAVPRSVLDFPPDKLLMLPFNKIPLLLLLFVYVTLLALLALLLPALISQFQSDAVNTVWL